MRRSQQRPPRSMALYKIRERRAKREARLAEIRARHTAANAYRAQEEDRKQEPSVEIREFASLEAIEAFRARLYQMNYEGKAYFKTRREGLKLMIWRIE